MTEPDVGRFRLELDEREECRDESEESDELKRLESVMELLPLVESDTSLGPANDDDASESRERLLFRLFLP
ncbi:hypothetical protein SAY87_003187 [Trapa incisa]|uniref:Uncharacterized protein n=1 Tax=Trapa incisa TaxID=236973 RepID=A0AAN7QHB7_9MYRT|nr:hypothetical protein SAY87_003187 [Trapa incisa]